MLSCCMTEWSTRRVHVHVIVRVIWWILYIVSVVPDWATSSNGMVDQDDNVIKVFIRAAA